MAMVRPWIGCLFGITITSMAFYFYLITNVLPMENGMFKGQLSKSQNSRNKIVASKELLNDPAMLMAGMDTSFNISEINCETIHVSMVCAGYNSTLATVTVVKSILFHRTNPLHFHLLVDEIAKRTLVTLFQTWDIPHVVVTYYKSEDWVPQVSWIPNKHYSGVYGLLKLLLLEVIPEDKILVFDTDVTVLRDIAVLWRKFDDFGSDHVMGLVENQSDWYLKSLPYNQRPWPALGRGFNTGVMMLHLKSLRSMNFTHLWKEIAIPILEQMVETTLADQDIFNAVIKKYQNIVFKLPCTWNIQLGDHTISEMCYDQTNQINIIHWNSPRKQNVRNNRIDDFRKMYQVFIELDGNLLRHHLFGCDGVTNPVVYDKSNPCNNFAEGAMIVYRTHLFLLEYEYHPYGGLDVALVTQCSAERITLLEELCKHWTGTISVALYLNDVETHDFINFVHGSPELRKRKNIAYHVVYKEGEFYPVNYLRNIAMSNIVTPYIFQIDIDFLPQFGLYEKLLNNIIELGMTETNKTALIVPAFETQRYRFEFPTDKAELLRSLNRGIFYTFRYHVWTQGHAATNYSFWRTATKPYEVFWEPDFEPYIVAPRSAPQYDTRFIGFGWNKVSYVAHLTALGYKYVVLPDTFIIHRPHAPSLDIGKFRTDPLYRRCLKKLKDIFVEELILRYGENSTITKLKKKPPYSGNSEYKLRGESTQT